ncbi:MAG: sigma-54-dependent Fis family transcriptional regulator [Planctomycetales bacterium]|nr:sigma-54-dependent Fis family transcriptional regulator [Planctomycetales bacterium]
MTHHGNDSVFPLSSADDAPSAESAVRAGLSLLIAASRARDLGDLMRRVGPALFGRVKHGPLQLVRTRDGQWENFFTHEAGPRLPVELLGDVANDEHAMVRDNTLAIPLNVAAIPNLILLVGDIGSPPPESLLAWADAIAEPLASALSIVVGHHQQERRIRRLETLVRVTEDWNQTLDMAELLDRMARAAAELFECQRASIVLWDRKNHELVLREGEDEQRAPDHQGVLGAVVQSGALRRIDRGSARTLDHLDALDHLALPDARGAESVETMLCVPIQTSAGEVLGAFELINRRTGNFSREDEFGLAELAAHAATALEKGQRFEQLIASRHQLAEQSAGQVRLVGVSDAMNQLRSSISRVAKTELPVLVLGENGTGKEVVSRMIHFLSPRSDEPFIAVNCAAISETLLEAELFGHEKGAFTDASESRQGKFEIASGGTLFLDEIGDLSLGGQAKLLRVLEDQVIVRVGGTLSIHTDARVIAATNQDLAAMVRAKQFREDLFFRLNVVTLQLPPLRDRPADIVPLAEQFLNEFAAQAHRSPFRLPPEFLDRLTAHPWPGNVRELRNLMERIVFLTGEETPDAETLLPMLPGEDPPPGLSLDLPLTDATREFQMDYIGKHIDRARGNMTQAAQQLGLHRSNLYRKMRQLGMSVDDDEEGSSKS